MLFPFEQSCRASLDG